MNSFWKATVVGSGPTSLGNALYPFLIEKSKVVLLDIYMFMPINGRLTLNRDYPLPFCLLSRLLSVMLMFREKSMKIFSRLILALSICSRIFCGEYDFTVDIPPGKTECYFQTVSNNRHKTMEIDYQVIDGGDLDVNFMIKFNDAILISDQRKSDATHRIEIKQLGDYELCFDNSFSQQSRKLVFFEIFLFDDKETLEDYDPTMLGAVELSDNQTELGVTIGDFHASSTRIKNHLNKIEYHQALVRAYEARDRAIMNANYERVTFWSIVNSIVLVAVGSLQVFMIRSLFDDNSKVGRLLRKVD